MKIGYWISAEARALGAALGIPRVGDAGFDLSCVEPVCIPANGFELLATGVHLAIPEGYVGLLRDRSSVALKGGAVTAGVIDASYRGEIKVAMHNLSATPLSFAAGERIAQCVIVPFLNGEHAVEVGSLAELGATARGSGGFGSTGK